MAGLHIDFTRKARCTDAFGNSDSLSTKPTVVEVVSSLSWVPGSMSFKGRWFSVKARPRSANHFPLLLA